jgi:hypothetical protein
MPEYRPCLSVFSVATYSAGIRSTKSCGRDGMDNAKPPIKTEVIPYIFYRDVAAALEWLARAFGFVEEMRHATEGGMHAQMTLDGQRIMMGQGSKDWRMQSPSETRIATMGISFTWPMWTRISNGRARQVRRSFRRHITNPTDAPTRHATSTDILGSLPRPQARPCVRPRRSRSPGKRYANHLSLIEIGYPVSEYYVRENWRCIETPAAHPQAAACKVRSSLYGGSAPER